MSKHPFGIPFRAILGIYLCLAPMVWNGSKEGVTCMLW